MIVKAGNCVLLAALALSACSEGQPAAATNASQVAPVNAAGPVTAPPPAAEAVKIERKDKLLEFEYGWPAQAAAIMQLDAWLHSHADGQFEKAHREAEDGLESAEANDYPFNPYSYQQTWGVVADTPDALVMDSDGYTYTGGAHGMPFTTSLIWDRKARKRLATKDVIDVGQLAAVARAPFCRELERQRIEKRGGEADLGGTITEFDQCVAVTDGEIVPMSRGGRALDTILIVLGPYVAGPYVEGSYVIELPVDAKLMGAVKPAYRGWFASGTP